MGTGLVGDIGVLSFDLDGVGSIHAIPPTKFTCFIDEFNKLALCVKRNKTTTCFPLIKEKGTDPRIT